MICIVVLINHWSRTPDPPDPGPPDPDPRFCRSMQTILLIRHASAKDREKWSQEDQLRPLTPAGHRQAQAIAEELAQVKIKQIRSSPAVRCVQTVEPLASRAKMTMQI